MLNTQIHRLLLVSQQFDMTIFSHLLVLIITRGKRHVSTKLWRTIIRTIKCTVTLHIVSWFTSLGKISVYSTCYGVSLSQGNKIGKNKKRIIYA